MRRFLSLLAGAGLFTAAVIVDAGPASAGSLFVTKTADTADGSCDADCSLREAIVEANSAPGADAVVVPDGTYVLSMTGPGDLNVTGDLTIMGGGAASTVIDGAGAAFGDRVFSVQAPAKLTVSDMTITNAAPVGNDAGALRIDPGAAADVARVAITRHATVGQSGSAISNNGTLTIHDSLIADNHTTASGAVRSPGTASFTNVTFSGNRAGSSGGALQASFGTSVTTLNNVTFAGNVADDDNDGSGDGGAFTAGNVFTIKNSIVAGNVDRGGEEPDCAGTVTSGGHNLVGNPSGCDGFAGAGDLTGVNPKLGQLADNGGPTRTHSVPKDSPAVNAGGTDCAATDQRGLPRSACDIGSYELVLCGKAEVKVIGTEGPDVLTGTAAGDGMIGLGGKDTLRGKGGKDGLCGGPGKDTLRGGAGKDRLVGGPGRDTCAGQAGRDRARSCERERSL